MASTFIRAFAIMLALTGFSATTYTGSVSTGRGSAKPMDGGPGMGGGPVSTCTNVPHCGLD